MIDIRYLCRALDKLMRSKRISQIILLFFLLGVWVLFASLRMMYNFSKLYTEEMQWFFLSDYDKREKLFGDIHLLYTNLNPVIDNHDVLLLTKDGKEFFLGRYYLYPQKIYWAKSEDEAVKLIKTRKYPFFVIYDVPQFGKLGKIEGVLKNSQISVQQVTVPDVDKRKIRIYKMQ